MKAFNFGSLLVVMALGLPALAQADCASGELASARSKYDAATALFSKWQAEGASSKELLLARDNAFTTNARLQDISLRCEVITKKEYCAEQSATQTLPHGAVLEHLLAIKEEEARTNNISEDEVKASDIEAEMRNVEAFCSR